MWEDRALTLFQHTLLLTIAVRREMMCLSGSPTAALTTTEVFQQTRNCEEWQVRRLNKRREA